MKDKALEGIKSELELLSCSEIDPKDPKVIDWMERAANIVRGKELKAGEKWIYDSSAETLVKIFIN